MKVRPARNTQFSEHIGGKQTCSFDSNLCATGVIVNINKWQKRAHSPKTYTVQFDPPNWGTYDFLSTEHLEEAGDEL